MRYFKSFFKHTWHPQQMDNPARLNSKPCDTRRANETELGELKSAPQLVTRIGEEIACRDGACGRNALKSRAQHQIESPWHYLKTFFLVAIIIALIVWILVYVLLSQYDVL